MALRHTLSIGDLPRFYSPLERGWGCVKR